MLTTGRDQIADNEPNSYSYALNGVPVQPYWSQKDNAFIVPDGNRQKFYLDPVWTGPTGAQTFTGQYDLTLLGDQLGTAYNDLIVLDNLAANFGTRGTMNGESVAFTAGQIRAVVVNGMWGSDTVRVEAVESDQTVNVGSWGADQVTVGDGSLNRVAGAVNVSNSSGKTKLTVNDALDTGRVFHVTGSMIDFGGLKPITYDSGVVNRDGSRSGVTSVGIFVGFGASTVTASGLSSLTSVYEDAW